MGNVTYIREQGGHCSPRVCYILIYLVLSYAKTMKGDGKLWLSSQRGSLSLARFDVFIANSSRMYGTAEWLVAET